MATYVYQVSSGSATATTDLGFGALGIMVTALTAINPTHLAYGFHSVGPSGHVYVTGSLGVTGNIGISGGALSAQAIQSGTWIVTAQSSAITASAVCYQNGTTWGVSASALTASTHLTAWGGSAVSQAIVMTAGMATAGITAPFVGGLGIGYRSDGSAVWDVATLPKVHDIDTAGTIEYDLGVSMRVGVAGGSRAVGVIDNAPSANASGFVDGTSPLVPAGFVYDETAGTTPTEDDALAARVDIKRAQVVVMEDATTRGRRATVTPFNTVLTHIYALTATVASGAAVNSATAVTGASVTLDPYPQKTWTVYLTRNGSVGTATATLQLSPDNVNWMSVTSITVSSTNGLSATAVFPFLATYGRVVISASAAAAAATASAWLMGGN